MSIFKRFTNVIRSNVNDVLDKAEDPRKILDQTILDMEGEHKKAKKMLLETLTLQKQAQKQLETYKKQSGEWESKAMTALKTGSEDLARQALAKKSELDGLIPEAQQGLQHQVGYTEELKVSVKRLEEKIEEAKSKRDELIARLNTADMKKKQAEGSGQGDFTSESTAFDTFDRMVEKIENKEAELEAREELFSVGGTPEEHMALDKELKETKAEDALEALKAKMAADGKAPPPSKAAEPAGDDAKAAAIEDELAALRKKLDDE